MTVQIITTPDGSRLVVLPEEEYRALVESADDRADRKAVRHFRTALAAGEEELVPAEVVERILGGENPIRVWREHRNLSRKTLATQSGIAPAYLSQMETGKRDGTVSTLRNIAAVLRIGLDDLMAPARPKPLARSKPRRRAA